MQIKNENNLNISLFLKSLKAYDKDLNIGITHLTFATDLETAIEYIYGELVIDTTWFLNTSHEDVLSEMYDVIDWVLGIHGDADCYK